jgi:hypothetical protein
MGLQALNSALVAHEFERDMVVIRPDDLRSYP